MGGDPVFHGMPCGGAPDRHCCNMIDSGEPDAKILAVQASDPRFSAIKDIKDIETSNPHLLKEIVNFFETYKDLAEKRSDDLRMERCGGGKGRNKKGAGGVQKGSALNANIIFTNMKKHGYENQYLIPTVIEKTSNGERAYDIYSRLAQRAHHFFGRAGQRCGCEHGDRAAFVSWRTRIQRKISSSISTARAARSRPGMAIYDTMQYVKPDVATMCVGIAASMGSFLLAAGKKGKRFTLPNSEILLHQVVGGFDRRPGDGDRNLRAADS